MNVPTPAIAPSLSRRSAIRLAAAAALATVGLVATAGCSSDEDTAATVDTLTTHLRRARKDADMAAALVATLPERAGALSVIQSERGAHADSLAAEIDRVAGVADESTLPATPPTTTTAQNPPPSLEELMTSLSESGRSAADSARNESGYRAGLLGSISAACTVQSIVVLA